MATRPVAAGFALEYSLGHITHSDNLKRALQAVPEIAPVYVDLPYEGLCGAWTRLPGVRSNWSLRASLGAYLGLRPQIGRLSALFFHTQVTSLLSAGLMRRVPAVISLDATPLQYDALGAHYGHIPSGNASVEAWKKRLNERAFAAARHLVTWSAWAKDSLVADYGVPAAKITVVPPGIATDLWDFPRTARPAGVPVQLLFVGGDFVRKGGDTLLDALARLPASLPIHLHVVTKTDDLGLSAATLADRLTVHRGVTPNSEALRALFAAADIFVFPTRGDCLPLAVLEALASGLPVITTDIGAIPEAVQDRVCGRVVPHSDAEALAKAIAELADDEGLRLTLGASGRAAARARYDAATNYRRLVRIALDAPEIPGKSTG